ncbi:hypothetical protein [Actinomadura atramentaria]|uniref:hypothetical protein n=1 Tax=Actinomadura atramentaria TaxID=1990 RepID=UPI000381AFBE|nr:hypothetical protein [Actinomadura atramentaria]
MLTLRRGIGVVAAASLLLTGTAHADAGTWRSVPSPFVPGGTLSGVAAVSASDAWVVGTYAHLGSTVFDHPQPVMQRWTGSGWQGYPLPGWPADGSLLGVAALSANDVWAAGYQADPGGTRKRWVVHFDGTAWRTVQLPGGDDGLSYTASVAAADGRVWIAFDGRVYGLAGGTWTSTNLPDHTPADLNARTASDVWAVGRTRTWNGTTVMHPTAQHWDGRTWTARPITAWPDEAQPTDVVAVGPDDVWAAGTYYDRTTGTTTSRLAHWNGTTWTNEPIPTGVAQIESLTRDPSGGAYATGRATDTQAAPAVLHLTAGTWRRIPVPDSLGTWNATLTDTSTTPTGTLWSVGTSTLGTLTMTNG